MSITKQDVEKIAVLASLELTEEEKDRLTVQMGAIVDYFGELNKLDTSNVEPMSHSTLSGDPASTWRDDLMLPSLDQDAALGNAPQAGAGHFKVPRVL
ncbi:MAG TPA: Asp-tRNA(Asn)/Glu-tRNA(Gln) amidotransferase subunit GatC [Acidobacteriota bacterium]|nr:Asp-tRNA(Asn)/Glu-tRNA(Gln) amidotransferase subunit GatC [Acidobacteriota bacterium]HNB72313.1 Asp-tRNA(Asn)/Glu-tRNA(Gln) amidotransferase subunit GatC [Acidobacteriota bacterium]HNG92831.1 Asp-tRNA(Asn)/Glu-tRNA(Gln) amidotransferase subunit GatC [Acidobacteriota bacterium]HNJ43378.1 Asp-tRNA(Asn)/Glu-tRNA(Gln) amidotransferase subunit GatC [Acidobacteriota bacterium]